MLFYELYVIKNTVSFLDWSSTNFFLAVMKNFQVFQR